MSKDKNRHIVNSLDIEAIRKTIRELKNAQEDLEDLPPPGEGWKKTTSGVGWIRDISYYPAEKDQ